MSQKDGSTRVVLASVTGNFTVAVAKLFGWLVSGSPSMLAESIHSLADTTNQVLLYIGIRHSHGRPTREFPLGRGQARYLWNLVSAIGIFFVGFGVTTYHGFHSLFTPSQTNLTGQMPILLSILGLSLIVEGIPLVMAWKIVSKEKGKMPLFWHIRKGNNPTTVAVLLEDSIAVLGVLFAFIGLGLSRITGSHVPDAVATICIGLLLGIMAVVLAVANGRLLLGVSLELSREEAIRDYIESFRSVEKVISLRSVVISPNQVRLSVEVEFHGSEWIDRKKIEVDAEEIRTGADPAPILYDTAERMVRRVGREINQLEAKIKEKFKDIVAIDLEVN